MYMLLLLKENVLKIQEKIDTRVIMKVNKNSKKKANLQHFATHIKNLSLSQENPTLKIIFPTKINKIEERDLIAFDTV